MFYLEDLTARLVFEMPRKDGVERKLSPDEPRWVSCPTSQCSAGPRSPLKKRICGGKNSSYSPRFAGHNYHIMKESKGVNDRKIGFLKF
jgi:hypothetical protein